MLDIFNRRILEDELRSFLPRLMRGEFECLEYGDPDPSMRWACALRIRYINTAGGPQFQIRNVSGLGLENASQYVQHADDALYLAMERIDLYHKPVEGIALKIKELRAKNAALSGKSPFKEPNMRIHPMSEDSTKSRLAEYRTREIDTWSAEIGAETINL